MVDDEEGQRILNFGRTAALERRQEAEQIGLPFEDLIGEAVIGEFKARKHERTHSTMWSVGGYRMKAVRNQVASALRQERKHHRGRDHEFFCRPEQDTDIETPTAAGLSVGMVRDDVGDTMAQSATIRALVLRLEPQDQGILALRAAGYLHADIGKQLSLRKATVGDRLEMIKAQLRDALDDPR